MVIHDLYPISVPIVPFEAEPPLIVDPNAPLAPPVTDELFQAIARQTAQVTAQIDGIVELLKLPDRHPLESAKTPRMATTIQGLRVLAAEAFNHAGEPIMLGV
jgi:hypothetical protein